MGKCAYCGINEVEGKAKTCSSKCRKALSRSVTSVTDNQCDGSSVTDHIQSIPGKCWCCGDDIGPGLVCCGPCAWSGRAKEKRAGRYPPLLTDRTPEQMERDLHSKELTGPIPVVVGVPGDEDYNGICR